MSFISPFKIMPRGGGFGGVVLCFIVAFVLNIAWLAFICWLVVQMLVWAIPIIKHAALK